MAEDWTVVKGFMSYKDDVLKTPLPDRVETVEGAVRAVAIMLFGTMLKSLTASQRLELVDQFRDLRGIFEEEAKRAKMDGRVGHHALMREFDRVIEKLGKSAR